MYQTFKSKRNKKPTTENSSSNFSVPRSSRIRTWAASEQKPGSSNRHEGRSVKRPERGQSLVAHRSTSAKRPTRTASPRLPATDHTTQEHGRLRPSEEVLRIIVLGGCEEVGRNMSLLEYGDDIIIFDMGVQFPEEDMLGIDYVLPNISYLKGKEKNIRGVLITHGHLDHIGAISYLIPELGYPTIYTAPLTAGLIRRRHEEFRGLRPLKIQIINEQTVLQLGKAFRVSFFHTNHTIPDSLWGIVDTPVGRVIHTGDFKFDPQPINVRPVDMNDVRELGKTKIRVLMADSTNASKEGHQLSESDVAREMEGIFQTITGRIIVGTFSSNLIRIQSLITLAEKYDRRVLLEGRSLNGYVEVAHELGMMKYKKGTIIEWEDAKKLADNRLLIICTGAQGERNAVLMRIATSEHKYLSIKKGDTVLFSSSVIPGNERTIQSLRDGLTRCGARVINYEMMDIHAGGHARKEDLRDLIQMLRPEYYMPIEANHYMLRDNAAIALEEKYPEDHVIVVDNGQVVQLDKQKAAVTDERVPADYVFVDGLGVGDVSEVVLRDRRVMAADGMLVVIVTMEKKTGELVQNPDLISRGFIYMKENKDIIEETRMRVKKLLKDKDPRSPAFESYIKSKIRNDIGQFLFNKTKRRPMILPVLIEV